jgi:cobalt-precorrin-5B (C1)-methyltransferase
VQRLTIGGGIGKITKLAQGAIDLHSGRSQVDFDMLAVWADDPRVAKANTALEAYEIAGAPLAARIAKEAVAQAALQFREGAPMLDVVVIDRAGTIIGRASR